ncbi:MAG: hypothetical protein HZB38_14085 [Planctomycetes bacterium]|nr:hypothetical protein [Planctomycetota bacterium]
MNSEKRNARVVAFLIGALTVGAAVLLYMEPRGGRGGAPLLMMESGQQVADVTIEFIEAGQAWRATDYDCVVLPSGEVSWNPRSSSIQLLVVGSGSAHLSDGQASALIQVLGELSHEGGLSLANVELARNCDSRRVSDLSPEGRDLTTLLLRKSFIH